jgi:transposase
MWTAENRARYERNSNHYPSDMMDEEWALLELYLPAQRRVEKREVLNAILYVLSTGC